MANSGDAAAGLEPNVMRIDLGAIAENFRQARRRMNSGRRVIGVIKADAYGHGVVEVAQTLSALGVDFLAGGSLKECIAVRRAGISTPIILLGALTPEAIPEVIRHRIIPSVDDVVVAQSLSRAATAVLPIFIKVDGGFGRFGVPLDKAAAFAMSVCGLPGLKVEGIYTHVPFSNGEGRDWAERQTRLFDHLVAELAARGLTVTISQSQASPGYFAGLADTGSATALGHLLYGLSPLGSELEALSAASAWRSGLESIRATLIHVGEPSKGAARAPYLGQDHERIGVISIGIQHGYRPTSTAAHVIIRGSPAPLIRVCLENTIIDLSRVKEARVGDEAVIIGSAGGLAVTLQDLAKWQATSQLALLTALGRSLPRTYIAA
jgi:alanine racemase